MSFDEQLKHLVEEALKEDIGDGDHSTLSSIDPAARGKAVLKIKEDGVLAGMEVARKIFAYKEPASVFTAYKNDGEEMKYGEKAFEVEASVHTILQCERLVLNCMQRMSGIATLTKVYTDKLKGYKTKLLDTRKTTPNFRLLEKEAVRIGGGVNHRFVRLCRTRDATSHIIAGDDLGLGVQRDAEAGLQIDRPEILAFGRGLQRIEIETRRRHHSLGLVQLDPAIDRGVGRCRVSANDVEHSI